MCTYSLEFVIDIHILSREASGCDELPLPPAASERRELTSPALIASFLLVIKPLIVRDHCFSFHRFAPPLVRLITLLCASEAESFRSNRAPEWMRAALHPAGVSPFTETHLSPALSSLYGFYPPRKK